MIKADVEPAKHTEALFVFLRRRAAELEVLNNELMSAVEVVLETARVRHFRNSAKQALQRFGLLTQSVEALQEFLRGSERALPHEYQVDLALALRNLPLAEIKSRLSGQMRVGKLDRV